VADTIFHMVQARLKTLDQKLTVTLWELLLKEQRLTTVSCYKANHTIPISIKLVISSAHTTYLQYALFPSRIASLNLNIPL